MQFQNKSTENYIILRLVIGKWIDAKINNYILIRKRMKKHFLQRMCNFSSKEDKLFTYLNTII